MIRPRRPGLERALACLGGLLACAPATARERAECLRAAAACHARGDAEGVYVAAERARGVGDVLPIADLRAKILDTDQVLLEYLVGDDATLIVLVSQDRCRSARTVLGADSLGTLVDALASGVRDGGPVPAAARALHALLIEPLEADLPPESRLVVSPDGPLGRLPFAALNDGAAFLVERHPLSSTTSATSLRSAPSGGEIVALSLGAAASAPAPPSLDATLPKDVALQRVQRAAIAQGASTRAWATFVASGRMHAPRRPSGEFPGWLVPIGMAVGAGMLLLALRRVPRATAPR